ncbi:hypothetical protein XELAEV_18010338mg [Xenopus laevis]|uniref:Selenoprotein M n=1 Tax=Xenopus laevis TaxID=8355 RepID=A0A974DV72_XENLA|nr:hypothetical protein XELAEV_18010338mg [Xenopus laevis]
MWLPLLLLGLLQPILAYQIDWKKLEKIHRGKVEVKDFITEDLPLYHNLEMKQIHGADPELILITSQKKELERIPLRNMKRVEINQLLKDLGFYRKSSPNAPVPAEFKMAPARTSGDRKEDL